LRENDSFSTAERLKFGRSLAVKIDRTVNYKCHFVFLSSLVYILHNEKSHPKWSREGDEWGSWLMLDGPTDRARLLGGKAVRGGGAGLLAGNQVCQPRDGRSFPYVELAATQLAKTLEITLFSDKIFGILRFMEQAALSSRGKNE